MRITKRQLRRIIREESKKHPALKGDQDKLPKGLQKAIIDKADDEWEEQNESSLRAKLRNEDRLGHNHSFCRPLGTGTR